MDELTKSLKIEMAPKNRALVYFHRFYVYQSMVDFHELDMVPCCLFVASKVEDRVIRLETLIKFAFFLKNRLLHRQAPKLETDSQTYFELKESLQINERILLQTLGFDLEIVIPGPIFLKFITNDRNDVSRRLIPDGSHKELAKVAWEWHNISYGSNFCVRYSPEFLAAAFLYCSARHLNLRINATAEGAPWWAACCPTATEDQLQQFQCELFEYCLRCREPRDPAIPRMVHTCPRHTVPLPTPAVPAAAAAAAPSPASQAPTPAGPSPGAPVAATAPAILAAAAAASHLPPPAPASLDISASAPPAAAAAAASAPAPTAAAAAPEPASSALPPLPSADIVAAALLGEF